MSSMSENASGRGGPRGALDGIRVVDLTRILAGPTCTQILGDLGADVVKVERPREGDDSRRWGPPFVIGKDGRPTSESAYYLSANRNKRSIEIDFTSSGDRETLLALVARADVLVENFRPGTLARYELGYTDLARKFPRLVYCSITGFGQTGPYAGRPGYDLLAQAMGGIMSLTGEPTGAPMKVGVAITDITTGLYATIGILAALRYRDQSGCGQHIDCSLLDTQVSWLINEATSYFTSGQPPVRRGNAHPNICPYSVYPTADGHVVLAVGNDAQFRRWCECAGVPELGADPRFSTNALRLGHRRELEPMIEERMRRKDTATWIAELDALGVPCGPVNTLEEVFADPHVRGRGMRVTVPYPTSSSGTVDLLANPIKLSQTPATYRRPPPMQGEHTSEVLAEMSRGSSGQQHPAAASSPE